MISSLDILLAVYNDMFGQQFFFSVKHKINKNPLPE
jgi:hypothetical protein